jgi:hypothetical protein
MRRFIEGTDRGQSTLFPDAWKTGSTRIIPFGSSTSLSAASAWRSWDLTGSLPKQPGALRLTEGVVPRHGRPGFQSAGGAPIWRCLIRLE